MIKKESLFDKNILNIFTDASITNYGNETIGCPGYVAVLGDNIISEREEIIRNSTNNNSEIIAISLAVEFLYYHIEEFRNLKYINLFSDSKISLFGLREWFLGWLRFERNGFIYNSSGDLVSNQDVFIYIVNMIMMKNIKINLYHQNGHINTNSEKSLQKAYNTFVSSNCIRNEVDIELIKAISYYNNMIDNNTRNYLLKTISSEEFRNATKTNYYFHHHIYNNNFDENKYKFLLNL